MIYNPRSVYTVEIIDSVICVVDLDTADDGYPFNSCSVTNDAERVIAELYEKSGGDMPEPVIYRDSMGTWDGMGHQDGVFDRFYHLNEEDRDRAITKAKARAKEKRDDDYLPF